jgi:hypothetical protein
VLTILHKSGRRITISEPTAVLYPRPDEHTFQSEGADIVCAWVEFGAGTVNPLASAIPSYLAVPLSSVPEIAPTIELLFTEAFERRDGRQVAIDRLAEYFLVLLLRSALTLNLIQGGMLIGLTDRHLARAVRAIHEEPGRAWTLEQLAQLPECPAPGSLHIFWLRCARLPLNIDALAHRRCTVAAQEGRTAEDDGAFRGLRECRGTHSLLFSACRHAAHDLVGRPESESIR